MERTECIKLEDEFIEVIIISKSKMFVDSDDRMLNRALYLVNKNL